MTIGAEFFEANRKYSMLPVILVSVGLISFSATDVVAWGAERFTSKPALTSVERAPTLQFTIDDVGLELARNDKNRTSSSLEIPTADAIQASRVIGSAAIPVALGVPPAELAPTGEVTNKAPDLVKAVAAAAPASTGISPQVVPDCYVRLNSGFQLYSNYDNTSLLGLADILIVGDSVVDGTGVVAKDTFPCQLEVMLSERRPLAKVHVLAFPGGSLGAYATLLELLPDTAHLERIVVGFNYDDLPGDPSAFTLS